MERTLAPRKDQIRTRRRWRALAYGPAGAGECCRRTRHRARASSVRRRARFRLATPHDSHPGRHGRPCCLLRPQRDGSPPEPAEAKQGPLIARAGRRLREEARHEDLLTLGQMLAVHARLHADRVGARDLERAMTFREWNDALLPARQRAARPGPREGRPGRRAGLQLRRVGGDLRRGREGGPGRRPDQLPAGRRRRSATSSRTARPRRSSSRTSCSSVVEEVRADLPVPAGNCIHFGGAPAPPGGAPTRS